MVHSPSLNLCDGHGATAHKRHTCPVFATASAHTHMDLYAGTHTHTHKQAHTWLHELQQSWKHLFDWAKLRAQRWINGLPTCWEFVSSASWSARQSKKWRRRRGEVYFVPSLITLVIPYNRCRDNINGLGQTTSIRWLFTGLGIWFYYMVISLLMFSTMTHTVFVFQGRSCDLCIIWFLCTPFFMNGAGHLLYMFTCSV